MKLELREIFIRDIRFDDKTHVKGSALHANKEEVEALTLKDDKLAGCHVDIVRPGESIRIIPVKDIVEPRIKVSGGGEIFPGVMDKIGPQVGAGKTHTLEECRVITAGRVMGFQEGTTDMSGPAADYCPFSRTNNFCLVTEPADGPETHMYEKTARVAGLKVAAYLGEAVRDLEPGEIIVCKTKPIFKQAAMYLGLPKVGYTHMPRPQKLLHGTYYYGVDAKQFVPIFMYPTGIMDGAVISGNCVVPCDKVTVYHHFHNPAIEDCFKHHGKGINFTGVIPTNGDVSLADKEHHSDMVVKLYSWIDLDGVLIAEEGYGNPNTDLMMSRRKVENVGTEVVLITDEFPGKDDKSQSLADACREADALASCSQDNAILILPVMDKVIGIQELIEI